MNVNFEKIKEMKITIPIAAVIAFIIFLWNISGKFIQFKDSISTDEEIEVIKEEINSHIDHMTQMLISQDKRILTLEVTNRMLRFPVLMSEEKPNDQQENFLESLDF